MGKYESKNWAATGWLFLMLVGLLSCTTSKFDAQPPHVGDQNLEPFSLPRNEHLEFLVHSPFFKIGKIELHTGGPSVADSSCKAKIWAQAHSSDGLGWLADIHHYWSTQIDTCLGITVSMVRRVKENNYSIHQRLDFFPDSQLIKESRIDKPERSARRVAASPPQMTDLLLTFYKVRFLPFERMQAGDTIRQTCFFDGEWLQFKLVYRGVEKVSFKGSRRKAYFIQPLGVQSAWLSGTFPVDLWIGTEASRLPLRIEVHSRLGKLEGLLSSGTD